MRLVCDFKLPEKYRESMEKAMDDGDYSWIRELLDYAELMEIR